MMFHMYLYTYICFSLRFIDSNNTSILYSPSIYIYEHTHSPYIPILPTTPIHEPHSPSTSIHEPHHILHNSSPFKYQIHNLLRTIILYFSESTYIHICIYIYIYIFIYLYIYIYIYIYIYNNNNNNIRI